MIQSHSIVFVSEQNMRRGKNITNNNKKKGKKRKKMQQDISFLISLDSNNTLILLDSNNT